MIQSEVPELTDKFDKLFYKDFYDAGKLFSFAFEYDEG